MRLLDQWFQIVFSPRTPCVLKRSAGYPIMVTYNYRRNTIQHCQMRHRFRKKNWIRRRRGLPSCTVGNDTLTRILVHGNIEMEVSAIPSWALHAHRRPNVWQGMSFKCITCSGVVHELQHVLLTEIAPSH